MAPPPHLRRALAADNSHVSHSPSSPVAESTPRRWSSEEKEHYPGPDKDNTHINTSTGAMDFLRSPFVPNPASSLQAPPPRRISTVAGDRLTAIVEDRPSTSLSASSPSQRPNRWSDSTALSRMRPESRDSQPPPYSMYSARQQEKPMSTTKRGGWKRFALIALIVIAILAIALGVGLGVGLNKNKSHNKAEEVAPGQNSGSKATFPIGDYSLVTALRTVQTNCTSNPATWRCFPYTTYASSPTGSVATFDWILTNTSSLYHTSSTSLSTNSEGVPANLSISSSDNPFALSFNSTSLTYVNATSPQYTFTLGISQKVIPTTSITSDNRATACFFNSTQLVGTLYLSDAVDRDFPTNVNGTSSTPWPYAVHIELQSDGGDNTPACYYTNNGVIGDRVTEGLTPLSADDQCICDYRNYS